jgi:uncharacterized protein involved in tolerance to divalent cations
LEGVGEGEEVISIVMTACETKEEAKKISGILLKKRLAACVKLSRVSSSYIWRGKIERQNEILITVITKKSKIKNVMKEIKKNHSYEAPEIIEIPTGKINPEYSKWVDSTCR